MAAAWPSTLPQGFLTSRPYRLGGRTNTVRHQTISGRFKAYRISTKTHRAISGQMIMSAAQWSTFETFYNATLGDGTLPFQDLTHPITKVNTVWQFIADPETDNVAPTGDFVNVSLELLALPDAPA